MVDPQGTWEYEYDAFGNRTAMVANGERTEYLIDPTGLVERGGRVRRGRQPDRVVHPRPGLEAASGAGGWRLLRLRRPRLDGGVSGAAGAYVNRYAYDPFGGSLLSSEAVANPFEFVGESA